MKVKMMRVYEWKCPSCGWRVVRVGDFDPVAPYCPKCWDGSDTLEIIESKKFESSPDYMQIHLHTKAMLDHLDKIEQEVNKGIKQGD